MPARKIKILTLIDGLGSGGAETIAARIAIGLDPTRFDRLICVTRATDPAGVAEAVAAGVEVLALRRKTRWAVWHWLPLIRLLRRERVDVLHAHKFGSNVWGTLIGSLARVPLIVAHEHGSDTTSRPLHRLIDRGIIGRRADLVIAVSEADRRRLVDVEGLSADKVRVIPNGVPPLFPSSRDVRAELGIRSNAPVVVTVAVVRTEKALGNLVRAAAILAPQLRDLRVLVAGMGPSSQVEELERLVRELRLEEVVTLLGWRADVPDVLAAADVAVICSDREGQPLALMEYMAAGKAIVATRVGGVSELIEDRAQGLLVPPRDVNALACAIGELLRDPRLREELGRRARERQRTERDFDVMVRRLEALYEELAARSRPPPEP
jgi:glycosyltransferase involved in cell wall biosynthesis